MLLSVRFGSAPITKSVLNYSTDNNNVISQITSLKINCRTNKPNININEGIYFSKSFNELIDILYFNIVNNFVSNLEGNPRKLEKNCNKLYN